MKILFVVEHYHPLVGGLETLFKNLAEGLSKNGHSVTVITSSLPDVPMIENVNGVEIKRVKVPQKGRRYWFTFLSIGEVLFTDCDIIQTTTYNGALPAWIASVVKRKPIVITVHEVVGNDWQLTMGKFQAKIMQLLERIIIHLGYSKYVAVSNSTKRNIQRLGVPHEQVKRIYNGIDTKHWELRNTKKFNKWTYVYYGRPGITKGVRHLVDAIPLVSEKIRNSRCILILGGEPKDEYMKISRRIAAWGERISNNIEVIAPLPYKDLPNFISKCHCVVIPSLTEGFGYSAVEACNLLMPVVITNAGSLPEVVSGEHMICFPRDAQSLADAIVKIHDGKGIQTIPKSFNWKDCVEQYESLYWELVK